jgi:hypothetical protein
MKTIVVKTEKVTSHKTNGMPVVESITQKISPELTFKKFIKYLPNQNYSSVTVVKVLEKGKELDQVKQYQSEVDNVLSPSNQVKGEIDYKALSEKQSSQLGDALKRIEALEGKDDNSEDRKALEGKANELNITFRSNIGDDNLLKKINEIEPDFKLKE